MFASINTFHISVNTFFFKLQNNYLAKASADLKGVTKFYIILAHLFALHHCFMQE